MHSLYHPESKRLMTDARHKFQQKLFELFQFQAADLDFGIYRIMNFRRAAIERFIEKELLDAVGKELTSGTLAEQAKAAEELEKIKQQLLEVDDQAVDADGNLADEWRGKKRGKEYLDLQTRLGGVKGKAENEALVFNHLYTFFSRYYDAGDFLSLRRYSRKERYAVPYNGEEVHLHWANSDQYFIKTGENFTDYAFRSADVTVRFSLRNAEIEQDNRKAEKRFFVPQVKDADFDAKAKVVTLPFEYRQLTDQEAIGYGKKNQQDAIINAALAAIPKAFKDAPAALAALMTERRKTAEGAPVSCLEHHLRAYTRRNTMDYFIHKNLRGFLERELDFYLKNEVLSLDEVVAGGEHLGQGWFQLMRTIRAIGAKIIAFLAQIEDFQKRLFEKRKFVTATHYCVTLSQVPDTFHEDIARNEAQWQEWKALLHIDEESGEKDLFTPKSKKARRLKFLKEHPTLVLDTRHFEPTFTDDLLATFENLDEATDGLLFHAENFQALNLLQEKFREKVNCIYIDPPYNTGGDGFPYKDGYQHSSWMSMVNQVLPAAHFVMASDAVIFSSISDHEEARLAALFDSHFDRENNIGVIVWHNARDNNPTRIATEHEYILAYAKDLVSVPSEWKCSQSDTKEMLLNHYRLLKESSSAPIEMEKAWNRFVKDNAPALGELERYKFVDQDGPYTGSESVHNPHPGGYDYEILHPITHLPMRKPANGYRFPEATMRREFIDKDRLIYGPDEKRIVKIKLYLKDYRDSLRSVISLDGRLGAYSLSALFGATEEIFKNPKPVDLVARLFSFSGCSDGLYLDFFAGSGPSGQAMIEINRESGSSRRFLLLEMAAHFDTVLLPRLKKVIFSPEWKDGKPVRMATKQEAERSPRIMKYHRLESYEDALNNIRLDEVGGQASLRFDDYLLNYMLAWESKDCETFLNVEKLASPFTYKLLLTGGQETREQPVDLPETFAYLIGLHAETRRVHLDKGRRYLVYRGRCGARKTAVIWRETANWTEADWKRDAEFVRKQKLADCADDVFLNTDSLIPNARSLDPVFKHRMFAQVTGM